MTDAGDTPGLRRAWGWAAHLRDGGTTPWRDWSAEGAAHGRHLPGAQQLELLRRLNASGPVPAALAGRVLEASAPGRGRPDLELAGSVEPLAFGPPPVDPADLDADELLRVATALLAEDVHGAGLPVSTPPRPRPWRTRYRLLGDPMLTDPRRVDLVSRGRPPGGRNELVLVVGTDVGQMLVDAWTARSIGSGVTPWSDWIGRAARLDELPDRIDLPRLARTAAERVGVRRVRVVLDVDALPKLVGVRRPLAAAPALSADAVELARRTGQVLALLAVPAERRALLRQVLVPRLAEHPGPALVLPPRRARWARERARTMRDAVVRAGYPVLGDPDGLLPVERPGVTQPSDAGVLALALRLLLEKKVP
ncbi:hypothetical protein ASC77_13590 [Nocardioides sp. Root1257]|uniref:hypothetical protein n=1 Tax=unclassified Nocardioides TaxID=2615069 RepID=UPI0006FD5854|nr:MULTISPECIES: hypothetical protein [unclassified Nocardioides]KQW47483.1 hypothetical protein ASC77_13590 [Nocardioides sp. Root1257]KRC45639.1 hypothetical protein ASE24_13595 [Nocardioides sp. Root224]